jgi:ACT domain-containing protein
LKFDLTLALSDRPGQLIKALEPIAKNGGNIISIIHEREEPAEGSVPVSLVVDFPSKWNLRKTIDDLKGLDIAIIKSVEIVETTSVTLILIGRMDLRKLVETEIKDVRITGFEVSAPNSKEACVKLEMEVPTGSVQIALNKLKKVSEEENAILVSSI